MTNPIWSIGGDDDQADESTYYWEDEAWSVPVIIQVSQLFKIRPQILQFTIGGKYWAETPDNGPEDWGGRAQLTFLYSK